MNNLINHKEALQSAIENQEDSNLARCYLDLLRRVKGIGKPFICAESEQLSPCNMPITIFVCPEMGSDGMAIYKLEKDYSAPSY
jgi:hypothetical protein